MNFSKATETRTMEYCQAQDVLVREQIEGGQELLDFLSADGIEVTAAFWAKETECDLWDLYIASPLIQERGIAEAYGIILGKVRLLPDPFEIKLVSPTDSIAKAANQISPRSAANSAAARRPPKYYDVASLGGIGVDGAYIYPLPDPAPAA
ncbi:MAG TPA: hypothetical protein VGL71_01185 [Urbifossiella sp.]